MKSNVIAKNTVLLFVRSIVVLLLTLYTSRIILQTLGVVDFGIYNVVGGVATLFVFISSTLTNAIQRFMSFELGRKDIENLNRVFACSRVLQLIIAAIILIFGETIGLWLLYNKVVIPEDRFVAAFWAYQFSLGLCIVQVTRIPYDAMIVAHERFSAFAYFSIANVCTRLIVALTLPMIPFDRLIIYALFIFLIGYTLNLGYRIYTKHHFEYITYTWKVDKGIFREMFVFSGWTFLGNIAWMGYTQGLDIVLNMFAGPIGNAATAIAKQVQSAVATLSSNIQTATNPQIIKSYSENDLTSMHRLILASTKYSFFFVWLIVLPLGLEMRSVLELWLGKVPQYAVDFTRLILIISLLNTMSRPLMTSIHATGNIKKLQIVESLILICIVPLAYIALKMELPFYCIYVVYILVETLAQIARMLIILPAIRLSIISYLKVLLQRMIVVAMLSAIITFAIFSQMGIGWYRLLISSLVAFCTTVTLIYILGLEKWEKTKVLSVINKHL